MIFLAVAAVMLMGMEQTKATPTDVCLNCIRRVSLLLLLLLMYSIFIVQCEEHNSENRCSTEVMLLDLHDFLYKHHDTCGI